MSFEINYHRYTSQTIHDAIKQAKNIIIPLGAVEAHGDHLPLDTDNVLVEYYANQLAMQSQSLVLPTISYGSVWSLSEAPGSIDVTTPVLVSYLKHIILSLTKNHAKMITLVSSHFGNIDAIKTVARQLYEISDVKIIYLTYPNIKKHLDIFEVVNNHSLYLHADEVETSMMLAINPKLVDMSKAQAGTIEVPQETDYTPTKWTAFSKNFIVGDARLATAEKGEILFQRVIKDAVVIILKEKEGLQ